jgi:hypothetical protein
MSPSAAAWLAGDPILAIGALVVLASVVGEAGVRWLRLPRITGYALTGMALGSLGVVPLPLMPGLRSAVDLCLGFVLFEVGARIDLGWFRRAPWMAALAVAESAFTGGALYALLHLAFGLTPGVAACGAALGISTSPAIALRAAAELSAQGQVTERMLLLSATNTMVAVLVLTGAMPLLSGEPLLSAVLRSASVLVGSLALAVLVAASGLVTLRLLGKRREAQWIAAMGLVCVAVGGASALGFSVGLTLLSLGAGLRGMDRAQAMLPLDLGRFGALVYVVLFALTSASLDLRAALGVGAAALAFVGVRALAKTAAVMAFAWPTRQPFAKAALLALALQPMSGLAAILVHDARGATIALAASIAPIALAAVAVLELAGALLVQVALRLAGEAKPEA